MKHGVWNRLKRLAKTAMLLVLASCSMVGVRTSQTPQYTVLLASGDKEIRAYPRLILATVTETGEYRQAQSRAFRRLASYIFGKNSASRQLAMTTSVEQSTQPSQRIAMTTPVLQQQVQQRWQMAFIMPTTMSMSTLPKPHDPGITLIKQAPMLKAVLRFSWKTDLKTNQQKAAILAAWVNQLTDYYIVSGPVFAAYNPPWTLSMFRRNEVMYTIKRKST